MIPFEFFDVLCWFTAAHAATAKAAREVNSVA